MYICRSLPNLNLVSKDFLVYHELRFGVLGLQVVYLPAVDALL